MLPLVAMKGQEKDPGVAGDGRPQRWQSCHSQQMLSDQADGHYVTSIMGSVLQEQFEEFQYRMRWLQEPAQALFLARANRLYLDGSRAPSENYAGYGVMKHLLHRKQALRAHFDQKKALWKPNVGQEYFRKDCINRNEACQPLEINSHPIEI